MRLVKRLSALVLSVGVLSAACGGSGGGLPSGQITYTSGTAQLTLSGDEEGTFDLELSSLGDNDFIGADNEGLLGLAFSNGDVFLGVDVEFAGTAVVPERTLIGFDTPTGTFTTVGVASEPCDVTATFDDSGVQGSFTCPSLTGAVDTPTEELVVTAEGTFSASE